MKLTSNEIINLNKVLLGKITPTGFSDEDEMKLTNLKTRMEVLDVLLDDIALNVEFWRRNEQSMKVIGLESVKYLKELKTWIDDVLESEVEE